jgi:uncharacterized protein
MDNMVTMAHFIFTGILDRFPKLRLGILESNAGWANFWLPRMDDHSHGRRLILGAGLPMKPSEYNLVWNTDYPHPDAPDPAQVLPWFSAQPISDDSKRKILWDNAVRLYGARLLESAP